VQDRARRERLRLARAAARELGCARIATGHTASDQAETVLFRMARGTGRTGALGMAPLRDAVIRPLLCLTGADTRAWCAERGLAVAADPGNADRAYARARVRHGLVPALAAVHPGAERHVAALADVLRDEAGLLEALVREARERCEADGGLAATALLAEPAPLRPLLVRDLMARNGLGGEALAAAPVERVLDAARRGSRTQVPGGTLGVSRGVLRVEAPG
jgi:tRNA(Ile)-lysidine synthase